MISTLLDTDLYKYTMLAIAKDLGDLQVKYRFKCRNDVDLSKIKDRIIFEINNYLKLTLNFEEIQYLNIITNNKLSFLYEYEGLPIIKYKEFNIEVIGRELDITINGAWWKTILLEVPFLALINEIFNNYTYNIEQINAFKINGDKLLTEKIKLLNDNPNVKVMEFGTRRRFSAKWQEHVLSRLVNETTNIIGTSNVALAKKYNINPLGTFAHEALQIFQALTNPIESQVAMFENWASFWGDKFLIALTDIFPQAKFLKDFNEKLAKKYEGVRHDSGDPRVWCREIIEHYKSFNIDPKTKTAVFSDGLDIPLCIELYNEFSPEINVVFGVGTNLTNDMGNGHSALQIVMKIVEVDGRPVAKLSNNPAKSMCEDPIYLNWLRHAIEKDVNNV